MNLPIKRVEASLYSLFIGDALSMPVHWFYRVSDILRYFPPHGVSQMEAAPEEHPSSIMSLHSTEAGGRRKSTATHVPGKHKLSAPAELSGEVVGDIILKGKRELWGGTRTHYHHGMQAGDNTLNACCARLMLRHLVANGGYDKTQWLSDYIDFMRADPPQHPDTYAESYHRGFFANLKNAVPVDQCGAVTHDTPSMGALVTVGPLALSLFNAEGLEKAQLVCCEHVQLTHPDAGLMSVVNEYVSLLYRLINLPDIEAGKLNDQHDASQRSLEFMQAAKVVPGVEIGKYLNKPTSDMEIVGGLYSTACYITDSWPSVCYLAAKYYSTPGKALLTNTNLGGENAHRGAVLGSLVGIAMGDYDEVLFSQLHHRGVIEKEVQQFTDSFF